jgi:hypothetical protein
MSPISAPQVNANNGNFCVLAGIEVKILLMLTINYNIPVPLSLLSIGFAKTLLLVKREWFLLIV